MKILISGTRSGLGRHIQSVFNGIPYNRGTKSWDVEEIKRNGVDIIIHCAFNSAQAVTSESLYQYVSDNVLLTRELSEIPNKKFIYISTMDVFPKNIPVLREDVEINVNDVAGAYGMTKLMSEAIVRKQCGNHLILRSTGLLGKYSRRNSLIRILLDDPCTLSLAGSSCFNYILHEDVSDFIRFAIENDVRGILHMASKGNISLADVAKAISKHVNFGSYHYDVGNIDNTKIAEMFPAFSKTSECVVKEFISKSKFACKWK
jgi:dTDP-4-dehydrorhamnose reductase